MLHTRNVVTAQNYNSRKFGLKNVIEVTSTIFSTKQLHLLILCTFQDLVSPVSANWEDTMSSSNRHKYTKKGKLCFVPWPVSAISFRTHSLLPTKLHTPRTH